MNKWVVGSQNVYKTLLSLYPADYRDEFAEDMLLVFRDENKVRFSQRGLIGLLFYWLRIIPDFIYTVLVEHISSPTVNLGIDGTRAK